MNLIDVIFFVTPQNIKSSIITEPGKEFHLFRTKWGRAVTTRIETGFDGAIAGL